MKVRNKLKSERKKFLLDKNSKQALELNQWTLKNKKEIGTTPTTEKKSRLHFLTRQIMREVIEYPKSLDYHKKILKRQKKENDILRNETIP